jgi:hypothetical protein
VRNGFDGVAPAVDESSLPFTAVMLFFASATFVELSTFPPDPHAFTTHRIATNNPRSALSRTRLAARVIAASILTYTRIRSC